MMVSNMVCVSTATVCGGKERQTFLTSGLM